MYYVLHQLSATARKWLCFICLSILSLGLVNATENNVRFEQVGAKSSSGTTTLMQQGIGHQSLTQQMLTQQTVTAIFQDARGFMWIGTQEGLNQYDGIKVTPYLPLPNTTNTLSAAYIHSIAQDTQNNIWVGTTNGLNVFDRHTKFFTQFLSSNDTGTLSHKTVYTILQSSTGEMWVGTGKGLNKFDANLQTFVQFSGTNQTYKNIDVRKIIEVGNNQFLLATFGKGLLLFDANTAQFTPIVKEKHDAVHDQDVSNIRYIYIDDADTLWVAPQKHGVLTLKMAKLRPFLNGALEGTARIALLNNYIAPELENIAIATIAQDAQNNLWLGSDDGLFYKAATAEQFVSLSKFSDTGLSDQRIWSLYSDHTGVFWVGTFNGLNRWNTKTSRFDYYRKNNANINSLSSNTVTAISSLNPHIYVGSFNGVDVIDTRTQLVRRLPKSNEQQDGLNDEKIMAIFTDHDNNVWFGYRQKGASKYDPVTGEFTHFEYEQTNEKSIGQGGVLSIFQSKKGDMFFGTINGGLSKLNPTNNTFTRYQADENNPDSISGNIVISIFEMQNGEIWLGTWDGGISIFSPESERFTSLKNDPDTPSSLSSNTVLSIYQDVYGNAWVGSAEGLNFLSAEKLSQKRYEFEHYNTGNGLSSNMIYGLLSDQTSMWLSTNKGITAINILSKDMKHFFASDGLQGDEFNSGAFHKAQDGTLYFGGNNGMTGFKPKSLNAFSHIETQQKPQVEITRFRRLNHIVPLSSALDQQGKITLNHDDYFIGFEFAALDFQSPMHNQYRYRLKGLDVDWIDVFESPMATYTKLPAGRYQFQVIAANAEGAWNNKGAMVDVIVTPPPWRSWWAYMMYCLIGMLVVWRLVVNSHKKHQAHIVFQAQLQNEVELRTAELSELNAQLKQVSVTDELSGLYNRRYVADNIQAQLNDISRRFAQAIIDNNINHESGPRLFILMLDIDEFKSINDNFGHDIGDKAIVKMANILKRECRDFDTLVRWGGDEFLVLSVMDNLSDASIVAERLLTAIQDTDFDTGDGNTQKLSSSFGYSFYPFNHHAPQELKFNDVLSLADQALYMSKLAGKNTWTGIVQGPHESSIKTLHSLSTQLHEALNNGDAVKISRRKSASEQTP